MKCPSCNRPFSSTDLRRKYCFTCRPGKPRAEKPPKAPKEKKPRGRRAWYSQNDVLGYIVDAYAGTETRLDRRGAPRRVFMWESGKEIKMGNTQAFLIHLREKFNVQVADAASIHALMRDLGEVLQNHKTHASRTGPSGWKEPEPEEWTVRLIQEESK